MLHVRESTDVDLPDIADLVMQVQQLHVDAQPETFDMPQPHEVASWLRDRIGDGGWRSVVAEVEGDVVGYVLFEMVDRSAGTFRRAARSVHVHQLGVASTVRRQGVGKALRIRGLQPTDATITTLTCS